MDKYIKKAERVLFGMGFIGSNQRLRIKKLAQVFLEHPRARVVKVADEKTGERYGRVASRVGRCRKIGYTTFRYQLWAEW